MREIQANMGSGVVRCDGGGLDGWMNKMERPKRGGLDFGKTNVKPRNCRPVSGMQPDAGLRARGLSDHHLSGCILEVLSECATSQ